MNAKRAIVLIVLTGSIVAANVLQLRQTRETAYSAQLLWRADEAYLLIGTHRLGWRRSYLSVLWRVLDPFGAPADDAKPSVTVLTITPEHAERHVVDNVEIGPFTVLDDQITDGGSRWTGTHFEPTTSDQRQRLRTRMPSIEFSNVDGWSKRSFLPMSTPQEGWKLSIQLGSQPVVLTVFSKVLASVELDLQRGGRQPERLWSLDERARTVSKAEYQALFRH